MCVGGKLGSGAVSLLTTEPAYCIGIAMQFSPSTNTVSLMMNWRLSHGT